MKAVVNFLEESSIDDKQRSVSGCKGRVKRWAISTNRRDCSWQCWVAIVVAESLTICHRCLSISKPRLDVFLDRIIYELTTINRFLLFIVESTTLETHIESLIGMKNCVDDFS